ncbi:hypothetical protein CC1G_02585 [Coprinopsis cinerea okayama7|uniref:Uncharacterized protein n=1 Tax=Coprinopsis cinerea (strain Okayama-7 / 130 / ATCC MYA-4618 / FGSC 9003) TaxID=240176 RepID=A8PB86_COPC7|nr:hypothetical protein CC1G_02585 [Coprinopsis cinerea okayama7\|eukprot:XP_001840122.2 hypothetical protein CC1G_02585 [Coprinopsis cinerea okayama7\
MYDRSIILLWVVGVAFVLQTLGGGLLNGLSSNWKGGARSFLPSIQNNPSTLSNGRDSDAIYIPGTKWGFCVPRDVPDFLWVFWCFVAAFDSLVCALALWEGIGFVRRRRRRSAREREAENADSDLDSVVLSLQRPPNLLRVLLRDSMIAPFITFIVCPLNLLAIVTTLPPTLSALVFQVTPMVPPLLGCRMILNLRGAYYRPFDEEYYTVPIYDEGTNPCPVFIPGDLELDSITSRVHAEFSNGKDDRIVA